MKNWMDNLNRSVRWYVQKKVLPTLNCCVGVGDEGALLTVTMTKKKITITIEMIRGVFFWFLIIIKIVEKNVDKGYE